MRPKKANIVAIICRGYLNIHINLRRINGNVHDKMQAQDDCKDQKSKKMKKM